MSGELIREHPRTARPDGDAVPEVPPQETMLHMIAGFWLSRAIYVAAKLGIADLVQDQSQPVAALAHATHTHAPSLYRVLRALASVGIFAEDAAGRFASTPLAATLRSDLPDSLRFIALTELGEEHYPAWEQVLYSVETGEIAFNHRFGVPVWDFFAHHPENAHIFDTAMARLTGAVNEAILSRYDFTRFRTTVDVAGGHGSLIVALLKANPAMRGVLFDLPHVVHQAKQRIEAAGLGTRCEVVAGDVFQAVPAGGEAYVLKWILHDWNDEQSIAILTNVRRAIVAQGTLLLVEAVIAPGNAPSFAKFLDLDMLVMTGGQERTERQYRELLAAGGFQLIRVVPTPSPVCVLEAVPM